jgi:hypothetical protein
LALNLLLVEDDLMLAETVCDGIRQPAWGIDHVRDDDKNPTHALHDERPSVSSVCPSKGTDGPTHWSRDAL